MIGKTTRVIFRVIFFSFFAFKKRKKTTGKVTRRLFASLFRASLSFKKQPQDFVGSSTGKNKILTNFHFVFFLLLRILGLPQNFGETDFGPEFSTTSV
jgi:hypothetical protein